MNQRLVKQMFDACYMAKRTRDLLPHCRRAYSRPIFITWIACRSWKRKENRSGFPISVNS